MMNPTTVRSFLESKRSSILSLLEELVNIQSGTVNVGGVNRCQGVIERELSTLDFSVARHPASGYGDHVVGRRAREGRPRIILDGHLDTVFPPESDPLFRIEGERCRGQGVVDMKGGVVCLLYSLQALAEFGLLDSIDVTAFLVSDEEVGSPTSRVLMEELARRADLVLCFEEAGKQFEVVVGRRGVREFRLEVEGRAGHSGNVLVDRRNAIEELAYKIVALREVALRRFNEGVLFNVGTIEGGIAANVIAERASCQINMRYTNPSVFAEVVDKMRAEAGVPVIKGTMTRLIASSAGFPPMCGTPQSLEAARLFQETARLLGKEIALESRGGGSDANLWSHYGASVLDGLGPIGGDDHSDAEWMDIPSLFERIAQTTLFLARMGER